MTVKRMPKKVRGLIDRIAGYAGVTWGYLRSNPTAIRAIHVPTRDRGEHFHCPLSLMKKREISEWMSLTTAAFEVGKLSYDEAFLIMAAADDEPLFNRESSFTDQARDETRAYLIEKLQPVAA